MEKPSVTFSKFLQYLQHHPGAWLSIVLCTIIIGFFTINRPPVASPNATSFQDCQKQPGSHILLTYPEQCITKSGQTFTQTNSAQATLKGSVSIGPLCPIESPGHPCPPNPSIYTAYHVTISGEAVPQSITVPVDNTGHFTTTLPPGTYTVTAASNTTQLHQTSQNIHLQAGQTISLQLSVDTGIR